MTRQSEIEYIKTNNPKHMHSL